MLTQLERQPLPDWIESVQASQLSALSGFARNLRNDLDTVIHGLSVSDQLSEPMRTVRSGMGCAHRGGAAWAWRWNPAPSAAPRGRCRLVVGVLIVVTLW
ncbi:hypothetical protein ABZS92_42385, partial [Streptomyces sp. NPDC005444]